MNQGCIRNFGPPKSSDAMLIANNKVQADMDSPCNTGKAGSSWLYQNAFNMAVRMELRRRGLPVAPVHGVRR